MLHHQRVSLLLLGVLVVACFAPAARAQNATESGKKAGEEAGAKAGAKAGAEAGAKAGEEAVKGDKFGTGLTDEDWARLKAQDPGAVKFFEEFDTDDNRHLNEEEFVNGIKSAIERRYLPPKFDGLGAWKSLQKDEDNEVNLRTFIAWASRTEAHSPPAEKPTKAGDKNEEVSGPKTCRALFDANDKNSDDGLDGAEFAAAIKAHLKEDKVAGAFDQLEHNGPKSSVNFETFGKFCAQISGLPINDKDGEEEEEEDPCTPNPCKNSSTVCVPNPRKCANGQSDCAQFKCVAQNDGSSPNDDGTSNNPYGKCVHMFSDFDLNDDRLLNIAEFRKGVLAKQAKKEVSTAFTPDDAWVHFEKVKGEYVDVYAFVHFCIATTADGADPQGTAQEECWDVYTQFDGDRDQQLDEREFLKGMRRARRQGHLPADLNLAKLWKSMPKKGGKFLLVGPFVDFCIKVSQGDEPYSAARDTQPNRPSGGQVPDKVKEYQAHIGEYGGSKLEYQQELEAEYQAYMRRLRDVDNVGTKKPRTDVFCVSLFAKADDDKSGSVSLDEFRAVCPLVLKKEQCDKDYVKFFLGFDTKGDRLLSRVEFVRLCKAEGDKSVAEYMTLQDEEAYSKLHRGARAGSSAGKKAGAEAGEKAGRDAGAAAAEKVATEEGDKKGSFLERASSLSSSGLDQFFL